MEVINTKKSHRSRLAEVLISSDEIGIYQTALELVLSQMSGQEIENKFGATRDEIEGDKVIVHNEIVKNPVVVCYAWSDAPADANLYSSGSFPAVPFRTDDWQGVTVGY